MIFFKKIPQYGEELAPLLISIVSVLFLGRQHIVFMYLENTLKGLGVEKFTNSVNVNSPDLLGLYKLYFSGLIALHSFIIFSLILLKCRFHKSIGKLFLSLYFAAVLVLHINLTSTLNTLVIGTKVAQFQSTNSQTPIGKTISLF